MSIEIEVVVAGPPGPKGEPSGVFIAEEPPSDPLVPPTGAPYMWVDSDDTTPFQVNPPSGVISVMAYGAVGDGVTDDTAAVQAALDATPAGSICYVPPGRYKITSGLTIPQGVHLQGAHWDWVRDATGVFGDVGWLDEDYLTGSVLAFTQTSGTALTASTTATRRLAISNIALVGPGTGTALGVQLGHASHALIDSVFSDILIGNFATGMKRDNVEDCTFISVKIQGCTTGLSDGNNTNGNYHASLIISYTTTVGHTCRDLTNMANHYVSSLFQSNTGPSLEVLGNSNVWDTPYFENPDATVGFTVGSATTHSAVNCEIRSPQVEGANYATVTHSLAAGSGACFVTNMRTPLVIANAGSYNSFTGRCDSLTNSGGAVGTTYMRRTELGRVIEPFALAAPKVANESTLNLPAGPTESIPTTGLVAGSLFYETSYARIIIWDGAGNWRHATTGNVIYTP